jgi:hypothetical protein
MVPLMGHDNKTKNIAEGGEVQERRDENFSLLCFVPVTSIHALHIEKIAHTLVLVLILRSPR